MTVALENVGKTFKGAQTPVLQGISARFEPGKIIGLIGPDGAGKTTLLRLIAGLLAPTSGRILAFGADVERETPRVRRFLGYMPQKFGLYEDLTVLENLQFYAKLRELPRRERAGRFAELLETVGLAPFQNRLARRLSGGMKQKLGLACALVTTPKLLILDEPGVGVDPLSRRELRRTIRERLTPESVIIWSSTYLDDAENCDETLALNAGRAVFFGPPAKLTRETDGRVVRVEGVSQNERRNFLQRLKLKPDVLDASIQGDVLRVVLSRPYLGADEEARRGLFEGYSTRPTPSRFEDGFIARLGGVSKEAPRLISARLITKRRDAGWRVFRKRRATPSPDAAVCARGLTKRFGAFVAVSNVDFEIRPGEIFGLLGPNGAGKSTTFKMLCGLLRPNAGEGFVGGVSLLRAPGAARRRLGYMAQKFSLYENLSVRQNLEFFAGIYGLGLFERKRAVAEALEVYDLRQFADVDSGKTPLGFKQRLALAAATIHSPDVLFLDEPTSGVDPIARREFWGRIDALSQRGVATLVTTHFMDEAEYCDRAALIFNGRKIAEGAPDELKRAVAVPGEETPTLEETFVRLIRQENERRPQK